MSLSFYIDLRKANTKGFGGDTVADAKPKLAKPKYDPEEKKTLSGAGEGKVSSGGPKIEYEYRSASEGKPNGGGWEGTKSGGWRRPKGSGSPAPKGAQDEETASPDKTQPKLNVNLNAKPKAPSDTQPNIAKPAPSIKNNTGSDMGTPKSNTKPSLFSTNPEHHVNTSPEDHYEAAAQTRHDSKLSEFHQQQAFEKTDKYTPEEHNKLAEALDSKHAKNPKLGLNQAANKHREFASYGGADDISSAKASTDASPKGKTKDAEADKASQMFYSKFEGKESAKTEASPKANTEKPVGAKTVEMPGTYEEANAKYSKAKGDHEKKAAAHMAPHEKAVAGSKKAVDEHRAKKPVPPEAVEKPLARNYKDGKVPEGDRKKYDKYATENKKYKKEKSEWQRKGVELSNTHGKAKAAHAEAKSNAPKFTEEKPDKGIYRDKEQAQKRVLKEKKAANAATGKEVRANHAAKQKKIAADTKANPKVAVNDLDHAVSAGHRAKAKDLQNKVKSHLDSGKLSPEDQEKFKNVHAALDEHVNMKEVPGSKHKSALNELSKVHAEHEKQNKGPKPAKEAKEAGSKSNAMQAYKQGVNAGHGISEFATDVHQGSKFSTGLLQGGGKGAVATGHYLLGDNAKKKDKPKGEGEVVQSAAN